MEWFLEHVIIPSLEKPLTQCRELLCRMIPALEQRTFMEEDLRAWLKAGKHVENSMRSILETLQQETAQHCGHAAAFAMAEIAHHAPKFLGYFVLPSCQRLLETFMEGDEREIERNRTLMLSELKGKKPGTIDDYYEQLLTRYGVTHDGLLSEFKNAEQSFFGEVNAIHVQNQLKSRFQRFTRRLGGDDGIALHFDAVDRNNPQQRPESLQIPYEGMVVGILTELITNAVKVMKIQNMGTQISVSIFLDQSSIDLRVRDDGPGGDPDEIFAAHHTTTQRYGGSGMGLTLLRRAGEDFGDTLSAVKNSEKEDDAPGMTFICKLPLKPTNLPSPSIA